MKTVIVGGGKGCRAIIGLAFGTFLKELTLEIQGVVDVDPNAPGMIYAREHNIRTFTEINEALGIPGIELLIELTGMDDVLEDIYKILPPGMKLIDHISARIFWDLTNAQEERERQLEEMTRLEKKVEGERHFLQSLFDTIPDLVVVLNRDKKAIRVNESFALFVGITSEQAMGRTCEQLLENTGFATQCRETSSMIEQVFATGAPHTMIWHVGSPKEAYWEVTRTPIFGRDGEIEAVLGSWHKITERVRLRREIDSAEQRFRSFIYSARDWISIKDLDGRYVVVNPAIAEAFHRKPDEFVGRKPEEILPESLARMIKRHDSKVVESEAHQAYDEVISIDGRDHYFQTVRFPLTDYKGSTIGICTIARDITSEKELRNQLVQAEKLAAVGKLSAGVAHEINNPLTGILAFAEDLLDEFPEGDSRRDDIEVIIREALRCRDIVRNLLDFARQETPSFEVVSPNFVAGLSLLLVEKLPQFRNIEMKKSMTDDLPEIKCDPHQIQQVVLNVMLNAADAMDGKGTIKITTEYERKHDRCVISVEDNGPGIPENLIDKIFEPFFSTKGTNGLGLAVSWGIIERHGGVIEVDTAEEGGAIFRIVLPALHDED
jgi:PAS domain S-box-containing protein